MRSFGVQIPFLASRSPTLTALKKMQGQHLRSISKRPSTLLSERAESLQSRSKEMENEDIFFFKDCDFCGSLMDPEALDLRNTLEDHGVVRFDFCPFCGSNTKHLSDNKGWQGQVLIWKIKRRLDKKRFSNGAVKIKTE